MEAANAPGLIADGDCLYLQVSRNPKTGMIRKSWIYRYRSGGRSREMGLGALNAVSLASAREKAKAATQQRAAGHDPIEYRKQADRDHRLATERAKTFRRVAEEFIASQKSSWKSAKHAAQWTSTLKRYAYPVFGETPVADVTVTDIKKVLDPIWTSKNETADRVRGRVEKVLDYARAMTLREGDNPARWKGHLEIWLKAPSQIRRVRHHAALPYAEVAKFLAKLRKQPGIAATALEFTILTTARTGETVGARWDEIDLDKALWTIPAERMKSGREHVVPLSRSAVALLKDLELHRGAKEHVFCAPGSKKPLSNMAMLTVIKRMGLKGKVTTHGFRSSFRDWAAEQTVFDPGVAEAALAHSVGSKVQQAYLRADRLDQRKDMMSKWDEFILPPTAPSDPSRKSKRKLQM